MGECKGECMSVGDCGCVGECESVGECGIRGASEPEIKEEKLIETRL